MRKLPLKMSVMRWISTETDASIDDIIRSLGDEYGSERQFRRKSIENMLQTMKAVGIIKLNGVESLADGDVQARYSITEYGISRLKYIPKC